MFILYSKTLKGEVILLKRGCFRTLFPRLSWCGATTRKARSIFWLHFKMVLIVLQRPLLYLSKYQENQRVVWCFQWVLFSSILKDLHNVFEAWQNVVQKWSEEKTVNGCFMAIKILVDHPFNYVRWNFREWTFLNTWYAHECVH